MRFLTRCIAAFLLIGTSWTTAQAAWWEVPTDGHTTAEVRTVFARRLEQHRRDVIRVRRLRRDHRRELREAAAAAAAEAAATPTVTLSSAPTSSYSTSSSGGCLSDAEIASYARAAGFPESVIPTMVYIAAHRNGTGESGGCPGAINPSSGACGLWQLYPCYGGSAWLDPATNARLAYQKYAASGLSPWSL